MGILTAHPKLKTNEVIRWKSLANRVIGPRITSGGQLVMTNRRFFFQPNRLDVILGRTTWECPLDAITDVNIVDRDRTILTGGTRKRLAVKTSDGTEVFVVNSLKKKVESLRRLLDRQEDEAEGIDESSVRVADIGGLAKMAAGTALIAGSMVVVAVVLSGASGVTVFLSLSFLVSITGSALFGGVVRTAKATSGTVNGEDVRAQGVGRGGHGFLWAHVVVVTDSAIQSISVRPWSVGRLADAIELPQISSIKFGDHSLTVEDGRTRIALKASPPEHIAALLAAIEERVGSVPSR